MSGNTFHKFFFESLPFYFQSQDIGANLERFSSIFEDELEVYKGDIENLPGLISPLEVPSKYLSLLGYFYGMPPSITDEAEFRKLLTLATHIYKLRGTELGLARFFQVFGAEVWVTFEDNQSKAYDKDGTTYDDPENLYDKGCTYCTSYDLVIYDPMGALTELGALVPDATFMANFHQALAFLMPIGTTINTITYGGSSQEEMQSYRELVISYGGVINNDEYTYLLLQTIPIIVS